MLIRIAIGLTLKNNYKKIIKSKLKFQKYIKFIFKLKKHTNIPNIGLIVMIKLLKMQFIYMDKKKTHGIRLLIIQTENLRINAIKDGSNTQILKSLKGNGIYFKI